MTDHNPTRVRVIYTHFPHYRQAVFDALARSRRFCFEFHYDAGGIERTIASGAPDEANHHHMTTRRFGPLLWQSGAISLALRDNANVFVFLGNPFILSTWLASLIARSRGIRVFFWTHGWVRDEGGLKDQVRCVFYRLADGLMLYGERARKLAIERGFPAAAIHVIGNSLDYETQTQHRADLLKQPSRLAKTKLDKPYFLVVARLVQSAEINLAIEALALIDSDAALVVVGDGPCRSDLETLAHVRGVDVRFDGALYSEEDLAPRFMNCVAVVSPGKVGLLAMHALAYGAAVITHGDPDRQMPEFEILEEDVTGFLFSYGNVAELAGKMQEMLDKGLTERRIEERRMTAIAKIESGFTPQRQVELIETALEQKIDAGG